MAHALRPVAERHGVTPAAIAVARTLYFTAVTSAIVGARSPEQVRGSLSAATLELKEDDPAEIAAAVHATGAGTGPASPAPAAPPLRRSSEPDQHHPARFRRRRRRCRCVRAGGASPGGGPSRPAPALVGGLPATFFGQRRHLAGTGWPGARGELPGRLGGRAGARGGGRRVRGGAVCDRPSSRGGGLAGDRPAAGLPGAAPGVHHAAGGLDRPARARAGP
jgi:hypothetical protein